MSKLNIYLALAAILAAIALIVGVAIDNRRMKAEMERFRVNSALLREDVEFYRVRDSLNAARAEALELTAREFERFRSQDAALIAELKCRARDLAAVNKAQTQTILEMRSVARDTVIIRDSVKISAVAVHCGDAWYDFNGILAGDEFTGDMVCRDSLVIAETVKYRRFLGFLWKTRKVESRHVDCVSRNPHNTITGLELVRIEK